MAVDNLSKVLIYRKSLILKLLALQSLKQKSQKRKRFWMRRIYLERQQKGEFHLLAREMILFDHEYIFKCFRMFPSTYEQLLGWLAPLISKESTKMRESIGASERLAVTLRYCVTADAQTTIAAIYRISRSTVCRIITETYDAIWTVLMREGFLTCPSKEEEWKEKSQSFENKWNFSQVIGALNGKHIVMQAPHNAGSGYFNYKKAHSVVLLAICNANYEFILVDIGNSGRQSDGSVYANSHSGFCIENKKLSIPACDEIVNGSGVKFPYVFVADDAFGLKPHMMKPYPGQKLANAHPAHFQLQII